MENKKFVNISKANKFRSMAVSFADDNWFRGLICSLAAFGMIMIGYASYYGFLKSRWPDFDAYYDGEDEEFEANQKKIDSYKSQGNIESFAEK